MVGKSRRLAKPAWKKTIEKVGPCNLAGRFFGRMEDVLEQSDKTGLEHGFTLCANKRTGKVMATESCSGTTCSLAPVPCEPNEELFGDFHVHPHTSTDPSIGDIHYTLFNRQRVGCIASTQMVETNGIKFPRTNIGCTSFDIDNPKFESFRGNILPEVREANKISSALLEKQYIKREAITSGEWNNYTKKRDAIMKKLKDSGLYREGWDCPPLSESFGVVRRERVERAEFKKKT